MNSSIGAFMYIHLLCFAEDSYQESKPGNEKRKSEVSDSYLRSRIICGPFWGSFAVSGSFAVGDHLRYCTVLKK